MQHRFNQSCEFEAGLPACLANDRMFRESLQK